MMTHELHSLVAAAAPIIGINSAGAIWFDVAATPSQIAAARAVMAAQIKDLDPWGATAAPADVRAAEAARRGHK